MDPLLDRFHRLLRSMFQTADGTFSFRDDIFEDDDDADYREAWEELEDFLGTGRSGTGSGAGAGSGSGSAGRRSGWSGSTGTPRQPPEELRDDYACFGVVFGAPFEEVKKAHRKLVKEHHPDRHAGDPGKMKQATEKTQKLNYSFAKIKAWEAVKKKGGF